MQRHLCNTRACDKTKPMITSPGPAFVQLNSLVSKHPDHRYVFYYIKWDTADNFVYVCTSIYLHSRVYFIDLNFTRKKDAIYSVCCSFPD